MSGHPDDGYEDRREDRYDDRYDDRGADARMVDSGRAAVRAPGVFLILTGLIGLALTIALSVPFVFDPDMMVRAMKDLAAKQQPGQQKQDLEKQIEEMEKQFAQGKNQMQLQNGVQLGIVAALNVLAIAGGFALRGLGSRGLSLAGAIVSLIPCAVGCCPLLGMPAGIWALIVLSRPEVKAAFAAGKASRFANPDDQYLR